MVRAGRIWRCIQMSKLRLAAIVGIMAILGAMVALSLTPAGAIHRTRTIRGVIGIDVEAVPGMVDGDDWGDTATLGVGARTRLSDSDVTVASGSDSGEHPCNGTWWRPTAPRDKVCIYLANTDNATDIHGVSISPGPGGVRWGFKIVWSTPADNEDSFVDATWAYRLPLRH
jgi:hypothetical protein